MNFLDKRRSKLSPTAARSARQEAHRQIAMAESVAKRKTQRNVLDALAAILANKAEDA
ncbi:hypothetical protein NKH75_07045 [Mesorhizobium sp. M0984]|uniref:hypothetical protein n=1 Tax=Mesorhizobium sp. M0984 TaxID=2957041 RepID=UPI0033383868